MSTRRCFPSSSGSRSAASCSRPGACASRTGTPTATNSPTACAARRWSPSSANQSARDSFAVGAGEMFFVPSGALHHIENTGAAEAEFILAFTHERPEDFGLSGTFGAMTDAVLGNTYGLPASAFAALKRSPDDTGISLRMAAAAVSDDARRVNPHKFAVEAQIAPLASPAGSARLARKQFWPILENLAMFSLRVTDQGMREPHWHPA